MRLLPSSLVLVLVLGSSLPALGARVVDVQVFDNTKTTDKTVMYIAGVEKGDDIETEDIAEIETRLVSSGLFKAVEVYTTPVGGGLRVVIEAKDKHSWVIAPTYYNQPTNKGGGLGFGENNLFGKNKKLLLYGQYATGETFFIGAFVDPNIGNSPLHAQLDVYLRSARIFEFGHAQEWLSTTEKVRQSRLNYLNGGIKIGVTLARFASLDVRLRGAHVSYDDVKLAPLATYDQITGDPADVDVVPMDLAPPGMEGFDVSGETILTVDRRANWYGISTGTALKLSFEQGLTALGSEFDYWVGRAAFYNAHKFFDTHNLVLKLNAGYGENLPFQQEFVSGGTTLRGYKGNQFRGDMVGGGNVEYSLELVNIKGVALRALAFVDSRYTAFIDEGNEGHRNYLPDHEVSGLKPWKNSVGLGTRLFIRQIVIPLLGIDVGYGIEAGEIEFFLAIGLTEF